MAVVCLTLPATALWTFKDVNSKPNCPGPAEWEDRYGNEPRKGADILVQALEREGVGRIFAYPGGASMEIHQALTRSPTIRNILCRHEQVSPSVRE